MRANDLVGAHAQEVAARPARRRRPAGPAEPELHRRGTEPAMGRRRHRVPDRRRQALPRAVRDLFHRGIVGWDTSGRQDTILVVSALTMALARTGHPDDVIHHADKGSIYTSLDFAFAAGNADMNLSFGSTGDAYDNAAMETFWARLKVEIAWIRGSIWFETRADATPTCSSSSRSSTTGNATRAASVTSRQLSTLTSGATTTENRIWHNPVSRNPVQLQYSSGDHTPGSGRWRSASSPSARRSWSSWAR